MTALALGIALGMAVAVVLGVAALREPPVEGQPAPETALYRRPCAGAREALLRGLILGLLLGLVARMGARDVVDWVVSLAVIATICGALVGAGLVERAAARRRRPVVALLIGSGAVLSVLFAPLQHVYVEGMLRGGADAAVAAMATLLTKAGAEGEAAFSIVVAAIGCGLPCAYCAYRRIGDGSDTECLPHLALLATGGLAIPVVALVEVVCQLGAMLDELLRRRRGA